MRTPARALCLSQCRTQSKGVLGCCYVLGDGVAKDQARGLALRRESEAAGSCFGQFVVGMRYYHGCGCVAQGYAEAARLFCLAADQGHAGAQNNLGIIFEKGRGVAFNRAEAIRWYRLAAAQGRAKAAASLRRLPALPLQPHVSEDAQNNKMNWRGNCARYALSSWTGRR
jgi:TPR repeat protein